MIHRRFCVQSCLTVLLILSCFNGVHAQAPRFFQGSLSYTVEMKGAEKQRLMQNEPNNKLQMHIKGGSYIVNLMGGRYPKSFMFVSDSNQLYSMHMKKQIAYRYFPHNDRAKESKTPPRAKYIGKLAEVQGIKCKIYRAKSGNAYFTYFVNPDYRIDLNLYKDKDQAKANFLVRGLEGQIPLKTIKREGGLTVVTTLDKIKARDFSDSQFRIPPSFKVKKRDYGW